MSKKILLYIPISQGGLMEEPKPEIKPEPKKTVEETVQEWNETHTIKSEEDLDGDGQKGDVINYVTASEWAKTKKIKTSEVYKLIRNGDITAIKQNGRWMILL